VSDDISRRERDLFQAARTVNMGEGVYLAFNQCRQTNFRGRQLLCDWLQLAHDQLDRKDLEVFAYLLRVLLTRIVEEAIRAQSPQGALYEVEGPIGVEEYQEAVDRVRAQLLFKISERELNLKAFQVYVRENSKEPPHPGGVL
jgi:hypothetical protein